MSVSNVHNCLLAEEVSIAAVARTISFLSRLNAVARADPLGRSYHFVGGDFNVYVEGDGPIRHLDGLVVDGLGPSHVENAIL